MIACTAFDKYYLGKTDISKQGHLKYPISEASKVKNARNHRYTEKNLIPTSTQT